MSKLTFRRNRTTGTLHAKGAKGSGLTIFRTKDGKFQWRIWHCNGKLTVSARSFADEDAAMDDLLATLAAAEFIED